MNRFSKIDACSVGVLDSEDGSDALRSLVGPATAHSALDFTGVIVGELVGMTEDGVVPLVIYPGQLGSGAIAARSTVDLHGGHVGRQVVIVFDAADPRKPIVTGVIREAGASTLTPEPGQVEVEADGERMIVTAREQLVLRCGKARITLTRSGKVLIEGAYISSRSSGVNRIKGGSVQLN
jgi:hypothetical protein